MNAIIKHNYPASRLPADLRGDLPEDALVEVQVTPELPFERRRKIAHLVGTGRNVHGTEEEVLAHIREGRDDDR